jgi:hypothetical protein
MRLQVGLAVHFIGIDAHKDTLAAAVIDEQGRELAAQTFTTKPDGYSELIQWADQFDTTPHGNRRLRQPWQHVGFRVVDVPLQLTALGRRHQRNPGKTHPVTP